MNERALPTFDDVVGAATRLAGRANRTPVPTSRTVDSEIGAQVFFKCENLQRMGAFIPVDAAGRERLAFVFQQRQ
jgi:threonine dehydratase